MIEARVPWTLEGPYDSITFDPHDASTPWMLTAKPKTVVDDRREIYDYPRADGAHVGNAAASKRVWSLQAKLRADSHSDRNSELDRLSALLDSLRRADGLIKWEPTGYPAVQSIVRRMGGSDLDGGAGYMQPVTFSLVGGDPNVYSQAENSAAVAAGTLSTGANLAFGVGDWVKILTQNSGDTLVAVGSGGFDGGPYQSITMTSAYGVFGAPTVAELPPIAKLLYVKLHLRQNHGAGKILRIHPLFYDSAGQPITPGDPIEATIPTGAWTALSDTIDVPDGAVSMTLRLTATGWTSGKVLDIDGYVVALPTMTNSATATNDGKVDTPLRFEMTPASGIAGVTASLMVAGQPAFDTDFTDYAGFTAIIDSSQPRRIYTPDGWLGSNLYGSRVDPTTPFPMLRPGENKVGSTVAGTVYWRDAWRP